MTPFRQAVMVLCWFRGEHDIPKLGRDHRISRATAYRYKPICAPTRTRASVGTTIGTDWTGSLITVCTAAATGAALYALAGRVLGITEFRALTTALRINM
ncbi:hypothetical protein ABT294_35100 [Nonomuraea sp. NPDC000554]|uniref:hypothetical protein n=1 Tax=Nonomuraea sp. NPDC000554 TaxID=3154259 RepID=UPI0033239CB0